MTFLFATQKLVESIFPECPQPYTHSTFTLFFFFFFMICVVVNAKMWKSEWSFSPLFQNCWFRFLLIYSWVFVFNSENCHLGQAIIRVLSLLAMVHPLNWHSYDIFASPHIMFNVWQRVENGTHMGTCIQWMAFVYKYYLWHSFLRRTHRWEVSLNSFCLLIVCLRVINKETLKC